MNGALWVWIVVRSAVSLGCIAAAGFMAVKGIEGWGWFLFVALLALPMWGAGE
jgi:ABC-type phosphate transport system auxiliary subunit